MNIFVYCDFRENPFSARVDVVSWKQILGEYGLKKIISILHVPFHFLHFTLIILFIQLSIYLSNCIFFEIISPTLLREISTFVRRSVQSWVSDDLFMIFFNLFFWVWVYDVLSYIFNFVIIFHIKRNVHLWVREINVLEHNARYVFWLILKWFEVLLHV